MLSLAGCADKTLSPNGHVRVASSRGGAIVVTRDERRAVATNRTAGIVTVFSLDPRLGPKGLIQSSAEVVGIEPDSEPWAAVIGSRTTIRRTSSCASHKSCTDSQSARIAVRQPVAARGSEPTAIAITPLGGNLLCVANMGRRNHERLSPRAASTIMRKVGPEPVHSPDTGALGPIAPRPGLDASSSTGHDR